MENRFCKKCGTSLPENYKYNKCEGCRNCKIDKIKKISKSGKKVAVALVTVAVPVVIRIVTKGKK